MWSSTVGLVNGKHRYLTAETFGFKINSNGQALKKRQQWTIEPFPENSGPDGSISSAASVSSQCQPQIYQQSQPANPNDPCILTFSCGGAINSSMTSIKSSSNGSSNSNSEHDICGEEHENIAIKSHLNKYLAVDSFGNVTCDSEERTENARFTITICSMSQGRSKDEHIFWAFRNVERGYYLGTTEDGMICCNAKIPKFRTELWHLHLIPARGASFFAIKSLGRKRFARFVADDHRPPIGGSVEQTAAPSEGQLQLDSTITWGPETLFQFKYHEGGRYSLLTTDCLYLTNEGKCISWTEPSTTSDGSSLTTPTLPPAECLFTLEYHSGFLAFRDSFSHYLAAAGRSSVLRSRSLGVSRDELFTFEGAPIQVSLKASFNKRWVSIKQGVDLSANQMEISSKFETFQLTYHKQTQLWSIMTHDCNFWTVSQSTNTISVCKPGDYEALTRGQFVFVWSETDATCSLKYVDSSRNERWIAARKSGQLYLGGQSASPEPVKFIMHFQNRRLLNLRPVDGTGFVGPKSIGSTNGSRQLEANKICPDSLVIEYSDSPGSWDPANGSIGEPNKQHDPIVSAFNVKLNSTKFGHHAADIKPSHADELRPTLVASYPANAKELELCIDDNNNNSEFSPEPITNGGGMVESGAAPSVASIINSFSNASIGSGTGVASGANAPAPRTNSAVIKLANGFSNGFNGSMTQPQAKIMSLENASVSSGCSRLSGDSNEGLASEGQDGKSIQLDCCYLKSMSNGKYLVACDGQEPGVACQATNKACAQSWYLELRSHNCIAIRTSDNHAYMQLGTNGTIHLSRCEPKDASLWEF